MIIERFDPDAGHMTDPYDMVIGRLFKTKIPDYTYVGTKLAAPRLNIQQIADAFGVQERYRRRCLMEHRNSFAVAH
eukprot:6071473-Prymnesium_polylepis.1